MFNRYFGCFVLLPYPMIIIDKFSKLCLHWWRDLRLKWLSRFTATRVLSSTGPASKTRHRLKSSRNKTLSRILL